MSFDPGLIVGGLLGGFLIGLTGMGGGALLTPMLMFVFHVNPVTAVGSDLVASLVMKPVGGAVHWRTRTVRTDIVRWLCLGSVPGAFLGVGMLRVLSSETADHAVKVLLGAALVATAIVMVIRDRLNRRRAAVVGAAMATSSPAQDLRPAATFALGLIGGIVVGFTSVGSGSLMIVVLSLLYPRLSRAELVGTDLVQAVPLVAAAAIGHLLLGEVEFGLTAALLIGGLPGVFVGARLSSTSATAMVRLAMPAVLVVSGLKMLNVF